MICASSRSKRANAMRVAQNPWRDRQGKDTPTVVLAGLIVEATKRLHHLGLIVLDSQVVLD